MFTRFLSLSCIVLLLLGGAGCISSSSAEQTNIVDSDAAVDLRSYQEFSSHTLTIAREQHRPYMLFFYANWCKDCHDQEPIYQRVLSSSNKVIGFRVNFDTKRDLVQEYHVLLQNTAVFFDAQGKEVKRLIGPQTEQAVKEALELM